MPSVHRLLIASGKRLYYGWYIVVACNCFAIINWGVGLYNQGVFLSFFAQEYGWSRSTLSIGPTLFNLWAGVVGVFIGRLLDRRGSRPVLIIGVYMLGTSTITFGLTRHLWEMYTAFLLLGTGFACLNTTTLGKIVGRWFIRERTRAMAAATFGASLGGMLLPPLNAAVLQHWGGLAGGLTLAVLAMGVVVPLTVWVLKDGPEVLGLQADGDMTPVVGTQPEYDSTSEEAWTIPAALRTSAFWALAVSFFIVMIAQSGFVVHQVMFLRPTFGPLGAATVVTVTTTAGALGRIGLTLFGNRLLPRHAAAGVFLIQALGLLLSAWGGAAWILIVGSAMFGFAIGVVITLQPVLTMECFGQRSFGHIFGIISLGIRLGSAIGPFLFGVITTTAGSYRPVLILVGTGLGLTVLCLRWAVPPQPRVVLV